MSVDAGADRRRAHVEFLQRRQHRLHVLDVLSEHRRETVELLTQRHRNSILQLRASDLQHRTELTALVGKRGTQQLQLANELVHARSHGELHGRRVGVIRGLRTVHMIDRVNVLIFALLVASQLQGTVRDDFVRVHVRAGTRAALDDADDELVMQFAVDDLLGGSVDMVGDVWFQVAEIPVRARRGLLDLRECDHQVGIEPDDPVADRKVLDCTSRMDAPVGVGGHLEFTERILFDAHADHWFFVVGHR